MQAEQVRTYDVECQYRFRPTQRHQIILRVRIPQRREFLARGDAFATYFSTPYWTTKLQQRVRAGRDDDRRRSPGVHLGLQAGAEFPTSGRNTSPRPGCCGRLTESTPAWGAISRAIRAPDRIDHQSTSLLARWHPTPTRKQPGNPDF